MKLEFDVAIIGSGVAGMTAAIYLKRSGINCCLIEREMPGGQINKAASVKNYPGFSEISGPNLANNIFEQAQEMNVLYKYGNVIKIENKRDYKVIKTDIETINTKAIIIATGRIPKKLGIPNEKELIGSGVSYCALCDANFFKNNEVAVLGSSTTALEEAMYLSNVCSKVYIIYEKLESTNEAINEKIQSINNIKFIEKATVSSLISKDNKLSAVEFIKDNKKELIGVSGCFVYTGQTPASEAFRNIVKFDELGYIKVNRNMQTNKKGIFAAGDIVKKETYQLLTAMNDGVNAAISCIKYIKENNHR